MQPEKISELLRPFLGGEALTPLQLEQIQSYLAFLLKWNARINLTAIRGEEDIITRHFGESLFAAQHLFGQRSAATAIDFGSGAGFPGLPLAIYAPRTQVTLIESRHKKATFLKEAVRHLRLTNVTVYSARGETLTDFADIVTLRAVEKFDLSSTQAASLVAPAGRLALLIGESQLPSANSNPAFHWDAPLQIPDSSSRILLVGNRD